MTSRAQTDRSLPDRQHLGTQLRAAREALGMTQRHLGRIAGITQALVSTIETAVRDVLLSSLVDAAAPAARHVALVAAHHLPLLELTAAEVDALFAADAALSKLATTEETPS